MILEKTTLEKTQEKEEKDEETPTFVDVGGLYGELTQEKAADITYRLFACAETYKLEGEPLDFNFIVSTNGGSADEMFSLFDSFRLLREQVNITTIGLGKVKSAGVLLLASGKHRKMGRNCRLMIHNVWTSFDGKLADMKVQMKEFKNMEKRYAKCLSSVTKMSEKEIMKLLNKKIDVYLTPEEALEKGIIDEIF